MNSAEVNRFISDFSLWATRAGLPADSRRRLPVAVRKAVDTELPRRDDHERVTIRPFSNSAGLRGVCQVVESQAFIGGDQIFGVVRAPDWFGGWRAAATDEYIEDALWRFFYYTSVYVARSRFLNGLAAIALTYHRGCDSRYMEPREFVAPVGETMQAHLAAARLEAVPAPNPNRRSGLMAKWLRDLNGLDPWIHRVLFQYVRAVRLLNAGFWEDGINALDSVIDVASQFPRDRLRLSSPTPRDALIPFASLSTDQASQLSSLNELRDYFGAHPSQSGWWDVQDHYADFVEYALDTVKKVIAKIAEAERANRLVEPEPVISWSDWFRHCCHVLGPPIWFRFDGPAAEGRPL